MNVKNLKFKDLFQVNRISKNHVSYKRSPLFESLSQKDKDYLIKKFTKKNKKGGKNNNG